MLRHPCSQRARSFNCVLGYPPTLRTIVVGRLHHAYALLRSTNKIRHTSMQRARRCRACRPGPACTTAAAAAAQTSCNPKSWSTRAAPAGSGRAAAGDTNFLAWLRDTVGQAVSISERHASSKVRIRELKAAVESRFQLASLVVSEAEVFFFDILCGGVPGCSALPHHLLLSACLAAAVCPGALPMVMAVNCSELQPGSLTPLRFCHSCQTTVDNTTGTFDNIRPSREGRSALSVTAALQSPEPQP